MSILVVTLGFDEKFLIRSFMRRFGELDKVVIIGSFDNERSINALQSFENIVKKVGGPPYEILEVKPYPFDELIVKVSQVIRRNKGSKFILNLSGGMRILILGVLFAFLINDVDAEIEMETENFEYLTSFRISDLKPVPLSDVHLNILRAIRDGYDTINSIHNYLSIPLSTVWRRVKEMKENGLLAEETKLKITSKGQLILKIHEIGFSNA